MPECDFNVKFQSNFIKVTLRHGQSPVNLLHIFKTSFPKYTYGGLLLHLQAVFLIVKTQRRSNLLFDYTLISSIFFIDFSVLLKTQMLHKIILK